MAGKKKAESQDTENKNTDEPVYGDEVGTVETNAGPDASDGGVAAEAGLDEEG